MKAPEYIGNGSGVMSTDFWLKIGPKSGSLRQKCKTYAVCAVSRHARALSRHVVITITRRNERVETPQVCHVK